MKALKANAMYEGVYPLVSAISRPLISKHPAIGKDYNDYLLAARRLISMER